MQLQPVQKLISALLLSSTLLFIACSDEKPKDKTADVATEKPAEHVDIVARVGDEVITYAELNSLLNSSAMVGLSIPALGTPERNQMMLTMLDKADQRQPGIPGCKEEGNRSPYFLYGRC